ncbi:hypothetical protein GQ44DRAFT_777949 [Phaeosphaeriaceae sp. PMI808]|nr:hypothetical protein GQ44DRAFT_777949 [Phaeosphaeriaceae sp. PMI808]
MGATARGMAEKYHVRPQPTQHVSSVTHPWPLSSQITRSIAYLAGREASISLYIALGRKESASAALEAAYSEPFTYWDWHGLPERNVFAKDFMRWDMFMTRIAEKPERVEWVTRIAVAHWMEMSDLRWIAKSFTNLRGLDLSDYSGGYLNASANNFWPSLFQHKLLENEEEVRALLAKLTWLSIPDLRKGYNPQHPARGVLPHCTSLKSLCIRGEDSEFMPMNNNNHKFVCGMIHGIVKYTPCRVTTIELRLVFPFIDRLADTLKKHKSTIKRIGLDLGTWIQAFYQTTQPHSDRLDLKIRAISAAYKDYSEAYDEEHNKLVSSDSKWWLPKSFITDTADNKLTADLDCPLDERGHNTNLEEYLHSWEFMTLPSMLNKFREISETRTDITLFALTREHQQNSTRLLHPFALLQRASPKDSTVQAETYVWLNRYLKWRPILDWDWFVRPDLQNTDKSLEDNYRQMKSQWSSTSTAHRPPANEVSTELINQIKLMKNAGIPIHILIGRRPRSTSSLYWGWPHNSASWARLLQKPFDVGLGTIAPLIDTLTIAYDLRNPLDPERLQVIDMQQPYEGPRSSRSQAKPGTSMSYGSTVFLETQKMANKATLKPKQYYPLAPIVPLDVLQVGTYADTCPSDDDSNTASLNSSATMHQIATRAAYLREAVSWQRFWGEYASKLTSLSELNVRMPQCFDEVGSVRLARLLNRNKGWTMVVFADERQRVQGEDESGEGGEVLHSAGRFVRRKWICMNPPSDCEDNEVIAREVAGNRGARLHTLDDDKDETILQNDQQALSDAIKVAQKAANREKSRERELLQKDGFEDEHVSMVHTKASPNTQAIESRLEQRKLNCLEYYWREQVRAYIVELRYWECDSDANIQAKTSVHDASGHQTATIRNLIKSTRKNLEHRLRRSNFSGKFLTKPDERSVSTDERNTRRRRLGDLNLLSGVEVDGPANLHRMGTTTLPTEKTCLAEMPRLSQTSAQACGSSDQAVSQIPASIEPAQSHGFNTAAIRQGTEIQKNVQIGQNAAQDTKFEHWELKLENEKGDLQSRLQHINRGSETDAPASKNVPAVAVKGFSASKDLIRKKTFEPQKSTPQVATKLTIPPTGTNLPAKILRPAPDPSPTQSKQEKPIPPCTPPVRRKATRRQKDPVLDGVAQDIPDRPLRDRLRSRSTTPGLYTEASLSSDGVGEIGEEKEEDKGKGGTCGKGKRKKRRAEDGEYEAPRAKKREKKNKRSKA